MSNINPYNIDGTFPVAGQDNNSQGFRDNFTNTRNNFVFTKTEVEDLQSKGIFKANLIGTTLNNDMSGALISNALTKGFRESVYAFGAVSGSQTIDFSLGNYQTVTTAGSITISSFTNWPTTGTHARLRLAISVANVAHTLTLPSAVSVGLTEVAGVSSTTITFDATGTYLFEFSTSDAGTTVAIIDLSRNLTKAHGSIIPAANVSYNLGSSSSRFNYVYANTLVVSTTTTSGSDVTYTGNVVASNITANTGIYGTIKTATQGNITSLGTLTSLTVSGNITAGNLSVTGVTTHTGSTTLSGAVVTPITHTTIANASTTTLSATVATQVIEPTTDPIAVATLLMPASPVNGQRVQIGFGNTVTTITHSPNSGQTLKGALTGTVNSSSFGTWVYYTSESTWYRIG